MSPERAATTITPDEIEFCFDLLDHYHGPESERTHWLANQFTSFSDDPSEAEWAALEADAAGIIEQWRAARRVAA